MKSGRPSKSCFRSWQAAPSVPRQVRLVCWPWCGAGASVFRKLSKLMPATVEVLAVQLPGREDRFGEPLLRSMHEVVAMNLAALQTLNGLPTAFFGHSMGAVVASEVALAWRDHMGQQPSLLIASGHQAPELPLAGASRWHDADEAALLCNIGHLGGTPEVVLRDGDLMRTLLPVLRADYQILETYSPSAPEPLRCPLIACAGADDPVVSAKGLQSWARLTTGHFESHRFAGGHFFLIDGVDELTTRLADWINTWASRNALAADPLGRAAVPANGHLES
jgi:surfactin synthase thioesterase subunit